MKNLEEHVVGNLTTLGLDLEQAQFVIDACIEANGAFQEKDARRVKAYERVLEGVYSKIIKPLTNDLGISVVGSNEAINHIRTLCQNEATVISVTGMPATGKSTLLKQFSSIPGVAIYDSFWQCSRSQDYPIRHDEAALHCLSGGVVLAAGCLPDVYPDLHIHIVLPEDERHRRVIGRNAPRDQFRLQNWKLFNLTDYLLYDTKVVDAHVIINDFAVLV